MLRIQNNFITNNSKNMQITKSYLNATCPITKMYLVRILTLHVFKAFFFSLSLIFSSITSDTNTESKITNKIRLIFTFKIEEKFQKMSNLY